MKDYYDSSGGVMGGKVLVSGERVIPEMFVRDRAYFISREKPWQSQNDNWLEAMTYYRNRGYDTVMSNGKFFVEWEHRIEFDFEGVYFLFFNKCGIKLLPESFFRTVFGVYINEVSPSKKAVYEWDEKWDKGIVYIKEKIRQLTDPSLYSCGYWKIVPDKEWREAIK